MFADNNFDQNVNIEFRTYQWPLFPQLKHSSAFCGPFFLFLSLFGTTSIVHIIPQSTTKMFSTWFFNNELFPIDKSFSVHLLDGLLSSWSLLKVDKGKSSFHGDWLNGTKLGEWLFQVSLASVSVKFGYKDLSASAGLRTATPLSRVSISRSLFSFRVAA